MERHEPTLTPIKNGWHCGSRELNLTVRGDTEQEARRLYGEAVQKAQEIRERPEPTRVS